MVKMVGLQRAAFPRFAGWIGAELPRVPDKTQVWQSLLNHGGFTSDKHARVTLQTDALPFVYVEQIPGFKGMFSPAMPDKVSISKNLVERFEDLPGDREAQHEVEATVLHEIVHWSWANAKKKEPQEKGKDFELEAYSKSIDAEPHNRPLAATSSLGELSRQFESNGKPGAIGRDTTGGWSYGLYQLASLKGRVGDFLGFLRRHTTTHPPYADFEARLQAAGGDVGARQGTATFQATWKQLAADPSFTEAQHDFIKSTHYDPFITNLATVQIDLAGRSNVLHDVAWSVSVQHGPGKVQIFKRPWERIGPARADDRLLIDAIYRERSRVDVYFSSSTPKERQSVLKRFEKERAEALRMLRSA